MLLPSTHTRYYIIYIHIYSCARAFGVSPKSAVYEEKIWQTYVYIIYIYISQHASLPTSFFFWFSLGGRTAGGLASPEVQVRFLSTLEEDAGVAALDLRYLVHRARQALVFAHVQFHVLLLMLLLLLFLGGEGGERRISQCILAL